MIDPAFVDTAFIDTAFVDAGLIAAAVLYLVASLLLFVLGANLIVLSVIAWRSGPTTESKSNSPRRSVDDPDLPPVTVQLPIYNELYVAERVIAAAAALHYPADRLQIQVLDDSTDETKQLVSELVNKLAARGVNIAHVHRAERIGYKAGALAAGLTSATGQFVAIFDADFVPEPDFLLRTIAEFDDPDIAFVQGRWGHLNREFSMITKLQSLAIDAHFLVEQTARREKGFWFNFNGTAGIWRTEAITSAGGWTADTLTEDLDLSYRAHLEGWRGRYRADVAVPGELPYHIAGFRRQQHRWARGSLECAAKLLPSVWRSDATRLTKFQATAHLTAYSIHLLLFTLAMIYPLVVAAGARVGGYGTLYGLGYLFAFSSLAPGIFFVTGQRQLGRSIPRELPKIIAVSILGSGLMLNTVRAAVQILTDPNPEFERTAKFGTAAETNAKRDTGRSRRYVLGLDRIIYGELLLGLYCGVAAILAAGQRNWGIFLYAVIFAAGLLSLAIITVVQAVSVNRGRTDGEPKAHNLLNVDAQEVSWTGRS